MTRRPSIILEDVGAAIETLRAKGERVTLRKVQQLTAGSLSLTCKLMQEWIARTGR